MNRIPHHIILWAAVLLLSLGTLSCDGFLDIVPTGKVIAKTGKEYRELLTNEYKYFPSDRGLATFRGDEMLLDKANTSSEDYASFFDIWTWNDQAPQSTTSQFGWRRYYHAIYIANYIIGHQEEITEATEAEISQLVGECYMMRAYSHFLLVNLFAEPYTACDPAQTRGIPLQLEADVDKILSCGTVAQVYESVLSDMAEAVRRMKVENWETAYHYRFSLRAAKALRARVYLYEGDWEKALAQSAEVLEEYGELVDMNQKNSVLPDRYDSPENLLALELVMTSLYKGAGQPAKELFKAYQSSDNRKSKYYKQVTASNTTLLKGGSNEFCCSIRTAELYLTAAEAAVELDSAETALRYLEPLLRSRYKTASVDDYLTALRSMDREALRQAIHEERRLELAFEGHRWFDLRRWDRPELTKTYQNETYTLDKNDARYTLRIPSEALQANPALSEKEN